MGTLTPVDRVATLSAPHANAASVVPHSLSSQPGEGPLSGRALRRLGGGAIITLIVLATPAASQAPDGAVLGRGAVRVDVGGHFAHFNSRRIEGGNEPVSAWYRALVTQLTEEVAVAAGTEVASFFAATGGVPGGGVAGEASLGAPDIAFQGSTRQVPMRLAIGLLPRTEITFSLPLEREEVLVQRFWLEGGTLGVNPDPAGNAARLEAIDPQWRALGEGLLLPTTGSQLGMQLRERVLALTGEELVLPAGAADVQFLTALLGQVPGLSPPLTGLRSWRAGDLEVGGRVRLIGTFGDAAYPTRPAAIDFRLTAAAAARIPTGQEPGGVEPFTQLPSVGHSGFRVGLDADLFLGRRFWLSAGSSYLALDGAEEESIGSPLVETVLWAPATELSTRIAPRYRLTESISFGARYDLLTSGEERREIRGQTGTFALVTPTGSVHRAGLEMRYSTLAALEDVPGRLRGPLAVEFGLGYLQTIAAADGTPLPRMVVLQGSVLHRLW
jgi:hypothetical protein